MQCKPPWAFIVGVLLVWHRIYGTWVFGANCHWYFCLCGAVNPDIFVWWDWQLEFGINFFRIFWQSQLHSSGSVAPDVVNNRLLERSSTGTSFLIAAMKNSPLQHIKGWFLLQRLHQPYLPNRSARGIPSTSQLMRPMAGGFGWRLWMWPNQRGAIGWPIILIRAIHMQHIFAKTLVQSWKDSCLFRLFYLLVQRKV